MQWTGNNKSIMYIVYMMKHFLTFVVSTDGTCVSEVLTSLDV